MHEKLLIIALLLNISFIAASAHQEDNRSQEIEEDSFFLEALRRGFTVLQALEESANSYNPPINTLEQQSCHINIQEAINYEK